jgi:Fe-S-cluster-containing hydrogenase component 2
MSTVSINHVMKNCYACKTCELACSYHHTGMFQPAKSSISVERNHITGEWKWTIDDSCDLCENEAEPLCAKYCFYDAIVITGGDQ